MEKQALTYTVKLMTINEPENSFLLFKNNGCLQWVMKTGKMEGYINTSRFSDFESYE